MSEPSETVEHTASSPNWLARTFSSFFRSVISIGELLHLAMAGISSLTCSPRVVETLIKFDEDVRKSLHERALPDAKKTAALAEREIAEGFPLLHAQALVTLWTALEEFIRTFLARSLENKPELLDQPPLADLRVSVGEFQRVSGYDRYLYLVELLDRSLNAPMKKGVNRFEALLEPFGLSGALNEQHKRDLYELQQVRNLLVHRQGIVDRRFREGCPWLNVKEGDLFRISHQGFTRYVDAAFHYAEVLWSRTDLPPLSEKRCEHYKTT